MPTARDTDFSALSFRETTKFYRDLRELVYDEMNSVFPGFRSSSISLSHAIEADRWSRVDRSSSRSLWKWADAHKYYSDKKRFKRFDLSVSKAGHLLGLAYGMPSQTKTKLKINVLEATPYEAHKSGIKVFELISESAQIYADLLGADEIRIIRPVNDDVASYYCSFGYEYVEPAQKHLPVYCSLKVRG